MPFLQHKSRVESTPRAKGFEHLREGSCDGRTKCGRWMSVRCVDPRIPLWVGRALLPLRWVPWARLMGPCPTVKQYLLPFQLTQPKGRYLLCRGPLCGRNSRKDVCQSRACAAASKCEMPRRKQLGGSNHALIRIPAKQPASLQVLLACSMGECGPECRLEQV